MRKLTIALVLALMVTLLTSPVAFAWDVEDPEVASSEDFISGIGWDGDSMESYYGGQSWSYFETPSDGYNLYRDDVTDTGNLDKIHDIVTKTPDAIEGLSIEWAFPETDGGLWYMGGESPDTWYWATEPRGYNLPSPAPSLAKGERKNWFMGGEYDVYIGTRPSSIFNWSHGTYKWEGGYKGGRILAEGVSQVGQFNSGLDGTYKVEIPAGTQIGVPMLPGVKATGVFFALRPDGTVYAKMGENQEYSNECTIYKFVDGDWEVVVTFTKIIKGKLS